MMRTVPSILLTFIIYYLKLIIKSNKPTFLKSDIRDHQTRDQLKNLLLLLSLLVIYMYAKPYASSFTVSFQIFPIAFDQNLSKSWNYKNYQPGRVNIHCNRVWPSWLSINWVFVLFRPGSIRAKGKCIDI